MPTDRTTHVGVTTLHIASAKWLKAMTGPVVICRHSEPIAALVPYEWYLRVQKLIEEAPDGR